ncbi:MAG: hypothetical protein ABL902_07585 [Gallionella sp.]|nr:hypothetical protein [Gallionella sp.]
MFQLIRRFSIYFTLGIRKLHMRNTFIALISIASALATASENGKQMTIQDLARATLLLIPNLQIQACKKEHPKEAAQFQFSLEQYIAKVDHSFEIQLVSRREELETKVPNILFQWGDYIAAQFESEGGSITIEQCHKTAKEIENYPANELSSLVEDSINNSVEVNIKYAQEMSLKMPNTAVKRGAPQEARPSP